MGFGLGCHSNCGGSSQTLGNPPVTLADLSPPKPEDNGSAGSGGPGRLSAQPPAALPAPTLPGPALPAPGPALLGQSGLARPQGLCRPSTSHTRPGPHCPPSQSSKGIRAVPGESPHTLGTFHTGETRIGGNARATFKEKSHQREIREEGAMRKETLPW